MPQGILGDLEILLSVWEQKVKARESVLNGNKDSDPTLIEFKRLRDKAQERVRLWHEEADEIVRIRRAAKELRKNRKK